MPTHTGSVPRPLPGGAFEGEGPRRRPQKRLGRRLEEVAKAVGGGYCRLQMPLKPALAARETVAGLRLGALGGRAGVPPLWAWVRMQHHAVVVVVWVDGPTDQPNPSPEATPEAIRQTVGLGGGGRARHDAVVGFSVCRDRQSADRNLGCPPLPFPRMKVHQSRCFGPPFLCLLLAPPMSNDQWAAYTHRKSTPLTLIGSLPPPPWAPAYAQPLSPKRQVPASMAFVTDSNCPQPIWQPPPKKTKLTVGEISSGDFLAQIFGTQPPPTPTSLPIHPSAWGRFGGSDCSRPFSSDGSQRIYCRIPCQRMSRPPPLRPLPTSAHARLPRHCP